MAWSEAARRAAAEARRRRKGLSPLGQNLSHQRRSATGREHPAYSGLVKSRGGTKASTRSLLKRARDFHGDSRKQGAAVKKLADRGYHPKTGRKVGKKASRRAAARIGDMANE